MGFLFLALACTLFPSQKNKATKAVNDSLKKKKPRLSMLNKKLRLSKKVNLLIGKKSTGDLV
jgi:hypothetical protein